MSKRERLLGALHRSMRRPGNNEEEAFWQRQGNLDIPDVIDLVEENNAAPPLGRNFADYIDLVSEEEPEVEVEPQVEVEAQVEVEPTGGEDFNIDDFLFPAVERKMTEEEKGTKKRKRKKKKEEEEELIEPAAHLIDDLEYEIHPKTKKRVYYEDLAPEINGWRAHRDYNELLRAQALETTGHGFFDRNRRMLERLIGTYGDDPENEEHVERALREEEAHAERQRIAQMISKRMEKERAIRKRLRDY